MHQHRTSVELVVEAIHRRLTDRSIDFQVGASQRAAHGSDKRVIWVPQGGSLTAPNRAPFEHEGGLVTPVATNALRVSAVMEAGSAADLEAVWVDVLTATREVLGTSSAAGSYVMDTEFEREAVSASGRARLSQAFEWRLLVSRIGRTKVGGTIYARPRTLITAHDLTFTLDAEEGPP